MTTHDVAMMIKTIGFIPEMNVMPAAVKADKIDRQCALRLLAFVLADKVLKNEQ
jgi:hypothetical protein